MYWGQDDFNPPRPTNDWARIFVREYRAAYGTSGQPYAVPGFYPAGYYDATFVLWALFRRALKHGGNVGSGTAIQAELERAPAFPSVFGGAGGKPGLVAFDTVTHGLTHRPL